MSPFIHRLGLALAEHEHFTTYPDFLKYFYMRACLRFRRPLVPFAKQPWSVRLINDTSPFHLRVHTTDFLVLHEIFVDDEYRVPLTYPLGQLRQILDLGANIGLFTRYICKQYPNCKVIAVEPDEDNCRMYALNAKAADLGHRSVLIQACVASSARSVTLNRNGGEWGYRMQDADAAVDTIPAMPLEEILAKGNANDEIDLLKSDIEGAECEVFANCAPWISRVRNIIIELHGTYTSDDFLNDIRRNGGHFKVLCPRDKHDVMMLQRIDH